MKVFITSIKRKQVSVSNRAAMKRIDGNPSNVVRWVVVALLMYAMIPSYGLAANASDRPKFQAPYRCGQSWDASTYAGHWPDADTVDLMYWKDSSDKLPLNKQNRSKGRAVLASAAGVVIDDGFAHDSDDYPEGARHVYLDHGDGWYTHYLHLERSPVPLWTGRRIAQGEKIGRTGGTATYEYNEHIHYTQMEDDIYPPAKPGVNAGGVGIGQAVRIKFNGQSIDSHAGNPAIFDNVYTESTERIVSMNCAGNSFVRWSEEGEDYLLRYKPSERKARIMRLNENGQGAVTTELMDGWNKTWTHFTRFYGTNDRTHLIRYNSALGKASFMRLEENGSGVTNLTTMSNWYKGWTHLETFLLGSHNYFLTYDSQSGYFYLGQIQPNGKSYVTALDEPQDAGWTSIIPFDMGSRQYLFFYSAATGNSEIQRVYQIGSNLSLQYVSSAQRQTGWLNIELLRDQQRLYLLGHNPVTAQGKIWELATDGSGMTMRSSFALRDDWTNLTSYDEGVNGRVLLYSAATGEVKIKAVDNGGVGLTTKWTGSWDSDWR